MVHICGTSMCAPGWLRACSDIAYTNEYNIGQPFSPGEAGTARSSFSALDSLECEKSWLVKVTVV